MLERQNKNRINKTDLCGGIMKRLQVKEINYSLDTNSQQVVKEVLGNKVRINYRNTVVHKDNMKSSLYVLRKLYP